MTKKIVEERIDKSKRISHSNSKNELITIDRVQNIQVDNKEGLNMDSVKSVEPSNTAVHSMKKIDITNVPLEDNTKENTEHPDNQLHYLKASHGTDSHLDPKDSEELGVVHDSQNKPKNIIDPEVDNDAVYKLSKRAAKNSSQEYNAISVSDIKNEVEIHPKESCSNLDINSSMTKNHDIKQRYKVKDANDHTKIISKKRCEVCSNRRLYRPLSLESSTDNASTHSRHNQPTKSSDDYKCDSRQSHCRECKIHNCEDNIYRLFRRLMKSLRLHPYTCKHFLASKHLSSCECRNQRESCYCHYHNPSKQKYTNEVGFNNLRRHLSPRTIRLLQTLQRPSTVNNSSLRYIKKGSTYRLPSGDKLDMELNDTGRCYRCTASHPPSIEYDDPLNLYNSTNIATQQFHEIPNNLHPWYPTNPLIPYQPRLIVRNIPIPVVLPNNTPLNQSIYSHQLPTTNSFVHPTYHTLNTLQQIPYIPPYYIYP
ncbi:spindle assembly checkpoint component MAD1 (Mitotic arrest deficient 1) [Schistosoma japonicum]|uniref:Spindle assembly checkpoint component MAD1 (Mitotic arrest deficient 1) n=1 Tax=Schistosoma japonicum TaxID=6182 RepID=A0A4Z2DND0_SCHJA|nr:spindle assembly checkpoint component MAD1 (Mitotic arrest deficient 1) [Schistosoma japonicum]